MATSYTPIYNKFYKKLVNDKKFFNYKGLSESEIIELVADHSLALLNEAIDYLYTFDKPTGIDFYNKDDILLQFNETLVSQEISLLAEIMMLFYIKEDINKIRVLGLTFSSKELNLFSPANDRKTFLEMYSLLESKTNNKIINYFARNRKDWSFKSIY
jgi:hypothetical protein